MERYDFPSAMAVLTEHMNKELYGSQVDLMYLLFDDFAENAPFVFDNGLVNRWLKGRDRLSPQLSGYYADRLHQYNLCKAMEKRIMPLMDDPAMAAQELADLLIQDPTVSDYLKKDCQEGMDFENDSEIAVSLTAMLCFAMSRKFVKHGLTPSTNTWSAWARRPGLTTAATRHGVCRSCPPSMRASPPAPWSARAMPPTAAS